MKEIILTQGKVALVDDQDFDWLNSMKWCTVFDRGNWYASRRGNIRMHALLAGKGADHKDGNGLNNQRNNLRGATHSQNCANQKIRSDNSSGYKGVNWHTAAKKYIARVSKNGIRIYVGLFDSAVVAARAYDRVAFKLFGEYAKLNFPSRATKN